MGEFKIGLEIGGVEMVTRGLSISSSELEDEEEVESFLSKIMDFIPLSVLGVLCGVEVWTVFTSESMDSGLPLNLRRNQKN